MNRRNYIGPKGLKANAKNKERIEKLFKKESLSVKKKRLTTVFNMYIRIRDTLYDVSGQPYFICISSGKKCPITEMHAGHYFSAGHNEAIRFDERNVNGQSMRDNYYLHGNFDGYTKGMLKKYGQKVIDELEIKRHNLSKMTAFEVDYLISEYESKIEDIKHKNKWDK